ncbi:GNAT family N-acetyltransferase [Clostridium cylindrosporum]|uniref:Acetyltransferase, ribosomal protein N-acetylase n=1 Tax=Clostridium cylindrosporum DSM 605 TaxID=1121307 RepID=A0A0J8DF92_CLOCY|nr:GNAT family N-acetyltransferase [Clostridium cylindrosporum]KMT22919.1 acetyltransferase, ribosomal protein N-acetylase [Clostridium cylindrosporum DSM 605]
MYIYTLKNSKSLCIRKAVVEDTEEILNISNQVAGETSNLSYSKGEYYMTYDQQYSYISRLKDSRNSCFLVGIIDGKIVASVTFLSSSRKRMEHRGEMGIAVLKDFWGVGVGKALMDCFLKWAKSNGITKKIDLLVREDNIPAISLYLKFGFQIEGRISKGMLVDSRFYDIYLMGKTLK